MTSRGQNKQKSKIKVECFILMYDIVNQVLEEKRGFVDGENTGFELGAILPPSGVEL